MRFPLVVAEVGTRTSEAMPKATPKQLHMIYHIRPAKDEDHDAILEVMRPWNMHHVPSPEMEPLNIKCFFVACIQSRIIGAAGYKILSPTEGKTTLLSVLPDFSGMKIGRELQDLRLQAMRDAGVKTVTTNADQPETIVWYKKHYGYREVGKLKKICDFGLPEVDHWTTLQLDLGEYYTTKGEREFRREQFIRNNDPHPLSPYPPLIINACLTGMIPRKSLTPHVPISEDEIIEDGIRVFNAGARIVHLHARDEDGNPSSDATRYEKIITNLRAACPGIICCATTSGRNVTDFEKRAEVLSLTGNARPDMASLTTGSLNFVTGPSTNAINTIERLAIRMLENGIKPELEVFEPGMINLAKYLARNNLVRGPHYFNILLGNINSSPANIQNLSSLITQLPSDSLWSGTGLGVFQLPVNVAALTAGGHVRVGIEDSVFYDYGKSQLATNSELVRRIVRISAELQRPIATPDQARTMLGLDCFGSVPNNRH